MASEVKDLGRASAEYLQAIYELDEEGIKTIVQAQLARRLGLSPTTVWEGVRRLITDGLVSTTGRALSLTHDGRRLAEVAVRRHRLAERMLVDLLGIPWHLCHEQAEDWEKVITKEVERALLDKLDGEPVCPHGNPIPGARNEIPWDRLVSIAGLDLDSAATLVRLVEDVELDTAVLSHLESKGLLPQCELRVVGIGPDGTRTIETGSGLVGLGPALAGRLWVLPLAPVD